METKTYLYYSEAVHLGQNFEKEVMEDPSEEWRAVVEVSQQHASYLRTFFRLQKIIDMKHPDRGVRRIKYNNDQQVFSFYFRNLPCAVSFAQLINRKLPVNARHDKFPLHIQICDNRYAISLQIVPICCADLIFLPHNNNIDNIGPIVICTKVVTTITLLDPLTLRQCYIDAGQYWKAPFTPSF
ncbi:60S ribosomal export protein NMD3 [Trifolium pratense]|uniref:60S ribosomal export protein NMD3 n=1 Tax=Trifolium pratense TaxID=57577 RepID=A0A2K3JL90_TRIPR|nr:60S ribosomal export protein NMD3 [Trifolium pratense]